MNRYADVYKKNQVQTVTRENLVLMLYDGARKFLNQAIIAFDDNNIAGVNNNLVRSQDIIIELISGINFDAGEIAHDLFRLYDYMHYRLIQANIKKEKEPVIEVLEMIEDLRETWSTMLKGPYNSDYAAGKIAEAGR